MHNTDRLLRCLIASAPAAVSGRIGLVPVSIRKELIDSSIGIAHARPSAHRGLPRALFMICGWRACTRVASSSLRLNVSPTDLPRKTRPVSRLRIWPPGLEPCRIIEITPPGDPEPARSARGADVWSRAPGPNHQIPRRRCGAGMLPAIVLSFQRSSLSGESLSRI